MNLPTTTLHPRFARTFLVSLHDVAPPHAQVVQTIIALLTPRLGENFSLAVVPAGHGQPIAPDRDRSFLEMLRSSGAEWLLHGYTHRASRRVGLLGWSTGEQNELQGLCRAEVISRLVAGRSLLGELLGRAPTGFVPPAWHHGSIDPRGLHRLGLLEQVGLFSASSPWKKCSLATCSWDTDRAGLLAPLGEVLGRVVGRAVPSAIHHIVLHPLDLRRGWLPRALARIDTLLARGLSPVHFRTLLAPDAP